MEEIKDLIRQARLEAGLTQAELAERAGTSQPAVARYERGSVEPNMATFERLLAACGRRAIVSTVSANDATHARTSYSGPDMRMLRNGRSALLTAAAECGARDIRLFGSMARGEQHRDSDIDLLVELEPGRTLLDLGKFRRRAGDILGVPVDVATPDMLKEHIRSEALAQAQPL
jgi:predicted nucleotidyltransferase/DNA-binding XRE family transcriptional regulator